MKTHFVTTSGKVFEIESYKNINPDWELFSVFAGTKEECINCVKNNFK
jgi:hypothetical protein